MKKQKYAIDEWAATIPNNARPASQAPSQTTGVCKYNCSCPGSVIPSLTSGTSHLTALSVLTSNVKVISWPPVMSVKVKAKSAPDAIKFYSNGGLSNNDEVNGIEREVVVTSLPMGKK